MNINLFIYYGAKIDKIDYENLTRKLGFEYLYKTVYSKGLTFRDVGEAGATGVYIIGKEILWNQGDCVQLARIQDKLCDNEDNTICIDENLEDEVRQKLLDINITNRPQYYFFATTDDFTPDMAN